MSSNDILGQAFDRHVVIDVVIAHVNRVDETQTNHRFGLGLLRFRRKRPLFTKQSLVHLLTNRNRSRGSRNLASIEIVPENDLRLLSLGKVAEFLESSKRMSQDFASLKTFVVLNSQSLRSCLLESQIPDFLRLLARVVDHDVLPLVAFNQLLRGDSAGLVPRQRHDAVRVQLGRAVIEAHAPVDVRIEDHTAALLRIRFAGTEVGVEDALSFLEQLLDLFLLANLEGSCEIFLTCASISSSLAAAFDVTRLLFFRRIIVIPCR